jgi:hypothetical protein
MGLSLGKCPLGRLRRLEDNIEITLIKTGYNDGNWMALDYDCVFGGFWF